MAHGLSIRRRARWATRRVLSERLSITIGGGLGVETWRRLSRSWQAGNSTPTRVAVYGAALSGVLATTASPSVWMDKGLGETTYVVERCGRA